MRDKVPSPALPTPNARKGALSQEPQRTHVGIGGVAGGCWL
jgi:hypothetical protein